MNLQDAFLNQVRRERQRITMFLMNGVKLGGIVRGFDSFVVVVEDRGTQQVVYKHAISTMIPATPVTLLGESGAEGGAER
ncbi:MAG: RNA chaperone Hfq [Clostridia bacterium]|nr:RNA chaperone Hfq [Clostridia bacterium]MBQ3076216.1 RNA chaperone Hfq [Clostridia bacterium]